MTQTTDTTSPARGVGDLLLAAAEMAERSATLSVVYQPREEYLRFAQDCRAAMGAGGRAVDPRHFDILAEAMAEVKATSDGLSDQPIADIVQGCLDEIAALPDHPAPSGQAVAAAGEATLPGT